MNREQAKSHLLELAMHVREIVEKIDAGEFDEDKDSGLAGYQIYVGHLMDHLAMAWHFARMTDEQINSLTTEQYNNACESLPNLGSNRRLIGFWEKPFELTP